jgi:aryl-alcohol dehydrogenase-like predicted oxidoreductase
VTELIVGTAQFGAGYGITNTVGRITDRDMGDILGVAQSAGLDLFDTAPDYGDAQERLGTFFDAAAGRRFVSKFRLPADGDELADGAQLFAQTLSALRVRELYGLLFHRVDDLRDPRADAAWAALRVARDAGVVARIGASVYDAADLATVVERFPDLNLIQIPGNILDRRLLDHPTLHSLHDHGVEVHVRSAYLQGLLLAHPDDLPAHFGELRPVIGRLREAANEQSTSVMVVALGYLKNSPVVDAVLVGATNATELAGTIDAWQSVPDERAPFEVPAIRAELLDPRLWPPREEVG